MTQLVDRALLYDKAARWPSAAAMLEAVVHASQELFGEAPSKAALATLLGQGPPATARLPPPVAAPQPEPPRTATPTFALAASAPAARVARNTTAQPVSTALPPASLGPIVLPVRRYPWLVWAAAGLVATACVAAFGVSRLHGSPATVAAAAPPTPAVVAPTAAPATPPVEPVRGASAAASAEPAVTASARAGPAVPRWQAPPPSKSAVPTGAPSAAPAASAPPPAPSCTVVTDYDGEGQPHFRKVCR